MALQNSWNFYMCRILVSCVWPVPHRGEQSLYLRVSVQASALQCQQRTFWQNRKYWVFTTSIYRNALNLTNLWQGTQRSVWGLIWIYYLYVHPIIFLCMFINIKYVNRMKAFNFEPGVLLSRCKHDGCAGISEFGCCWSFRIGTAWRNWEIFRFFIFLTRGIHFTFFTLISVW